MITAKVQNSFHIFHTLFVFLHNIGDYRILRSRSSSVCR